MFFSRGNPVVYYGDEQGFTGAGGDKDARQTMFASKVPDYLADDELGTDRTHAYDAYDPTHPLYRAIAALSALTKANPALRDGVQTRALRQGLRLRLLAHGLLDAHRVPRGREQRDRAEDRFRARRLRGRQLHDAVRRFGPPCAAAPTPPSR